MIVLGIDPGFSGALAVLSGQRGERARLLDVIDVPCAGEKAKREVVALEYLDFIKTNSPDHAYIERAQAMPSLPDKTGKRRGMGASSSFNYGKAVGALIMGVQGMRVPLTVIESSHWKKAHALIGREKEDSRQRAISLFAGNQKFFARKKDHNRAEAALIAWYGLQLLHSGS